METFYDVLGVPEDADKGAIQKAYRRLAKMYHPDTVSSMGAKVQAASETEFKKINAARGVLLDKEARADYDRSIREYYGTDDEGEEGEAGQAGGGGDVEWGSEDYAEEVREINHLVGALQTTLEEVNEELRDTKERTHGAFGRLEFETQEEAELRWRELNLRDKMMARVRDMTHEIGFTLVKLEKVGESLQEYLDEEDAAEAEAAFKEIDMAIDLDEPAPVKAEAPKPSEDTGGTFGVPGPSPYSEVRRRWREDRDKMLRAGKCPQCESPIQPGETYCHSCGTVF